MHQIALSVTVLLISIRCAYPLATPLAGDWAGAKRALRSTDCCVVSVAGLESHLRVLQTSLVDGNGPSDLDLRTRIRTASELRNDCLRLHRSVLGDDDSVDDDTTASTTAALEELSRGVASLADGPLEGVCTDIFLRIVCASDYRARDPMFHTDKAPLRGYVTLRGVGTEYMTRTCTAVEYATLRGLGKQAGNANSLRQADELEFIVMKGDHYLASDEAGTTPPAFQELSTLLWKRAAACVHRSPPAVGGGRRVILSLDLGDGDDDREWYQADKKRECMTQRKSRLVA